MKIGVMTSSFRVSAREGILKAAQLGADGVQLHATGGEIAPDALNRRDRAELLDYVRSNELIISALCGDPGGHGFTRPAENMDRIAATKRIIELAHDLEVSVVTTHVGVIPEKRNHAWEAMRAACLDLGEFAAAAGVSLAIETGPEKIETLKLFLDCLGLESVKVNYDPGNLVMVTDDDPAVGVRMLGSKYIVHTHAKDGIMRKKTEPKVVYDFFAEGGIGDLRLSDYFQETPLGEGEVDFPVYLAALKEIGYDGFLTIEREVGACPEKDIAAGIEYLRSLLSSF